VLVVAIIRSEVPTDVTGIVMLIHFLIAVYMSGRIDERIQRLQFLWTQEVKSCFVFTDLMFHCYLCQAGYVFVVVLSSVCLFVC